MIIQVIYNPHSGGGRGRKLSPVIIQSLGQNGHMTIEHCTLYHQHATEIAKHIDLNRCDAIVVIGGDGTVYEVLNGLMNNKTSDKRPPLGMIPVGTGNSFAKDLNMYHWKDGIVAVKKGMTRHVDIMKFITEKDAFYSMNSIGFGIPADVSVRANKYKKFLGKWAYTLSAASEILRFKPQETRLEVDGVMHEYEGAFTNFSNSAYFGGNMKISPNSVIDDGVIEAVVLENMSRGELLQALPTVYSGEHLSNPYVKVYRGKHFKVDSVPPKICNPEGEIFGVTPLEITVLPKEIEFFIKPELKKRKKTSVSGKPEAKKPAAASAKTATAAKKSAKPSPGASAADSKKAPAAPGKTETVSGKPEKTSGKPPAAVSNKAAAPSVKKKSETTTKTASKAGKGKTSAKAQPTKKTSEAKKTSKNTATSKTAAKTTTPDSGKTAAKTKKRGTSTGRSASKSHKSGTASGTKAAGSKTPAKTTDDKKKTPARSGKGSGKR